MCVCLAVVAPNVEINVLINGFASTKQLVDAILGLIDALISTTIRSGTDGLDVTSQHTNML